MLFCMGCAKRISSFSSLDWNGLHDCQIRGNGFLRLRLRRAVQAAHWQDSITSPPVLTAGGRSSEEMNSREKSDQVLSLQLEAEVGEEMKTLRQGDSCIVPAGTPHRNSKVAVALRATATASD